MAVSRKRGTWKPLGRRLRLERLEERSLLSVVQPLQPVISDDSGNVFAVNLSGSPALISLGAMDRVMLDIGFTPAGSLLGLADVSTGSFVTSGLFSIPVNLDSPTSNVTTSLLGPITLNGGRVSLNALDVRADGTVFAAGTDSLGQSHLFTISAAGSGTQPATVVADLGSFDPAGDLTFDTNGNVYVSMDNGHLLKVNSGLTTVTDLGSTGFSDFDGLSHGSGVTILGFRENRRVYQLDPVDGHATFLATLSGSGLTSVFGAATVPSSAMNLGQIDFRLLTAQQSFAGGASYGFTAANTGIFTADLPNAPSGTNVQFALFSRDGDGNLTAVTPYAGSSAVRTDWPVTAGQAYVLTLANAPATFDLRLTDLVNAAGNTTTVLGTSGDDAFTFTSGSPYSFTINGVLYPFASHPAQTQFVSFVGGAGSNTAQLTGASGAETVTLSLLDNSGVLTAAGFQVDLADTGVMSFTGGGGGDSASLVGTSHNDKMTLSPQSALVTYGTQQDPDAFSAQVSGVPTISVDGGGGADTATFTAGSAWQASSLRLRQADFVANDASYAIHLTNTTNITAKAGTSGKDTAVMEGSPSNDTLVGTPQFVSMFATTFSNAANGFPKVQAFGGGGADSAQLSDGPGTNLLTATPTQATLSGAGYQVQVSQFSSLRVSKQLGTFNTATLIDSSGNDVFNSTPDMAVLSGTGFYNRVNAFNAVYAYSVNGGNDMAFLRGSPFDDTFLGRPGDSSLSGPGYYDRVKSFKQVYATAGSGGYDQATLYDSLGADVFTAKGNSASFLNNAMPYFVQATGFDKVTAIASGPGNVKNITSPIYFILVLQGF